MLDAPMSAASGSAAPPSPSRMLAVVVLYKTAFAASKTLIGLTQAFAEEPGLLRDIEVLVWDNSPDPLADTTLPFAFTYHHDAGNSGVAGAYNAATVTAHDSGCVWLLLLDHDTTVTGEFLRGIGRHAQQTTADRRIAAVVPFLYAGRFPLSPRLWRFARHQPLLRRGAPYTEPRLLFAANSGTLMRVAALEQIGGYSARFWLDYSDIYVFYRFHRDGLTVRIAADLALQHEVAMLDYDTRMSPARYATYLAAEGNFLDMYRGGMERAVHLLRLAARAVRQRRYANPVFARMTRQALVERLTIRRATRLASHEQARRSPGAGRG